MLLLICHFWGPPQSLSVADPPVKRGVEGTRCRHKGAGLGNAILMNRLATCAWTSTLDLLWRRHWPTHNVLPSATLVRHYARNDCRLLFLLTSGDGLKVAGPRSRGPSWERWPGPQKMLAVSHGGQRAAALWPGNLQRSVSMSVILLARCRIHRQTVE